MKLSKNTFLFIQSVKLIFGTSRVVILVTSIRDFDPKRSKGRCHYNGYKEPETEKSNHSWFF